MSAETSGESDSIQTEADAARLRAKIRARAEVTELVARLQRQGNAYVRADRIMLAAVEAEIARRR